jgi:hypothetical protein
MAKVELSRREAEDGHLPEVCMVCGAQAWKQKSKQFSWYPPWTAILILAGLIPFAIVVMILTKRMRVQVPLCDEHQNHWSWRSWLVGLGVAFFALLGIATLVLLAATTDQSPRRGGGGGGGGGPNPLVGLLCAGTALGGLVWLIVCAIVQQMAIRPTEITDSSITLTNVAAAFVDALEEESRRPDPRDRYGREPPPRRDWDDERYSREPPRRRDGEDDRYRERDDR